jgi:hypothetical protein
VGVTTELCAEDHDVKIATLPRGTMTTSTGASYRW